MKTLQKFLFSGIFLLAFFNCNCQNKAQKREQSIEFKVWGNCEMCKETIENALDVKGVKSADWNMETKKIKVIFDSEKITEVKIHQLIAASGYDTEDAKGNDKAYKELPDCCQYTRKP